MTHRDRRLQIQSHGILSLMNQTNPRVPLYTELPSSKHEWFDLNDMLQHGKLPHSSEFHLVSSKGDLTDKDPLKDITGDSADEDFVPITTIPSDFHLSSLLGHDDSYHHSSVQDKPCQCDNCVRKSSFLQDKSFVEDISNEQSYTLSKISDASTEQSPKFSNRSRSNPSEILTAITEVESRTPCNYDIVQLKDESLERRQILDMVSLRCNLANNYLMDSPYLRPISYHENFIGTFTKGLPHDNNGFVNTTEMNKLVTALRGHDIQQLSKVQLGSKNRLVNPSAAWSQDLIGKNSNSYRYSRLPPLSSDRMASQMVDLYCMSLSRDIPFAQYITSPVIADCCRYLNDLRSHPQAKGKVTPYNIYRGPMQADLQGPYISQLLYWDLKIGGFTQKQKYPTILEGHDFMKTWDIAIEVQNGTVPESSPPMRDVPRYIITGRDLASYVHYDEPCQVFYNASIILLNMKVPMNPSISKLLEENPVESYFINLGRCDIQGTLAIVARSALLAAWYVKWNSLFLRPEAYGIEVERVYRDNRNKYGVSHELLINPVIEAVRSHNGSALLTQVYEEGAPLHPSTPSGHAAIAGACATALKFFFDTKYEIDIYEPDTHGYNLVNTGKRASVGEEIDKLACNMAFGRNWAGVHYYMDAISGLKRGEKAALSCLHELIYRYPVPLSIDIHRFNDTIATIHN